MTKEQKIYTMRQKGYKFTIDSSKKLTVKGPYTLGSGFTRSYSTEWSDNEILVDAIDDVIRWAGYQVVERLELCV